jgi:hypothetical protein
MRYFTFNKATPASANETVSVCPKFSTYIRNTVVRFRSVNAISYLYYKDILTFYVIIICLFVTFNVFE